LLFKANTKTISKGEHGYKNARIAFSHIECMHPYRTTRLLHNSVAQNTPSSMLITKGQSGTTTSQAFTNNMVDVLTTMAIPHPFMERPRRHKLRAVMLRAGTSRGLFLHRNNLPAATEDLALMLTAAMGSRTCDLRQIEGVGGATSTTSKVALVARSTRPGVDVDYTFVQVAVGQDKIDMSGNCGNMCSGVAAFALGEGLITAMPGIEEV